MPAPALPGAGNSDRELVVVARKDVISVDDGAELQRLHRLSPLRADRRIRVLTVLALVGSQAAFSGTAFSGGGCSGGA
jgi:hypothetical protein